MLCFYKLGTKCSVRLATLKVFVYHHHSPPPGLAAVFWRPSQKILMSQLYAKEKGFLYLILGTQHLKSTNIHFTIWYTNLKADSGRRIQGMLVFSFCKMGQSFACWQQEAASEGCRACWGLQSLLIHRHSQDFYAEVILYWLQSPLLFPPPHAPYF